MMPSLVCVTAIESRSAGGAPAVAVRRKVLSPATDGAGAELVQSKTSARFACMTAVGTKDIAKSRRPPAGMLTGWPGFSGVPVVRLRAE